MNPTLKRILIALRLRKRDPVLTWEQRQELLTQQDIATHRYNTQAQSFEWHALSIIDNASADRPEHIPTPYIYQTSGSSDSGSSCSGGE